jgi:hypothetical protein
MTAQVFYGNVEIQRRFRDRDLGDVAIVFVDNVYVTGEARFVTVDDMEPSDVVGPIIQRAIEEFLGANFKEVDTYEHGEVRHVEDDLYEVKAQGRIIEQPEKEKT